MRPWPYIQGVALKMNPKCDEEGSFFFGTLILSAVFQGNSRKIEPDFSATPLQTAERMKFRQI